MKIIYVMISDVQAYLHAIDIWFRAFSLVITMFFSSLFPIFVLLFMTFSWKNSNTFLISLLYIIYIPFYFFIILYYMKSGCNTDIHSSVFRSMSYGDLMMKWSFKAECIKHYWEKLYCNFINMITFFFLFSVHSPGPDQCLYYPLDGYFFKNIRTLFCIWERNG